MDELSSGLDKSTLGTKPLRPLNEFDLDHYVTLTVKVKTIFDDKKKR